MSTPESSSFVREEGGRTERDQDAMQRARDEGTCPFCKIVRDQVDAQPVVYDSDYWAAFYNISPEAHTALHLVVAAKDVDGHDTNFSYDDLSVGHKQSLDMVIWRIAQQFQIADGRSVIMRIGKNGDHNAQTVFHPHFHVMVSDGKPIEFEAIPEIFRNMLVDSRPQILAAFKENEPVLFSKASQRGKDKLWSEALKYLWTNIALLRSFIDGKAGEIRPKLSNKAFHED